MEMAPPIELPTRWTGPRSRVSMSLIMVLASALTEYPDRLAGGAENPDPGRSTPAQSKSEASSAIRSVQLVAAPDMPCTQSTRSLSPVGDQGGWGRETGSPPA